MKDHSLKQYVQVYKNAVDDDTCRLTVNALNEVDFKLHEFYDEYTDKFFHNENELSSYYERVELTHNAIMGYTWNSIKRYTSEMNFSWWNSWAGYTLPKYNKYVPGTQMKEHCDHIKSIFDGNRKGIPILTVLTGLNDEYTGGELILFGDEEYKLGKGDTIIFPSNFLYPHRIDPVKEGVRYSCVSWVW